MPDIRYVCLSDLHLGEEDSLLTDAADVTRPSPVLSLLAECLARVLQNNAPGAPKPTLVLAGDVLELALGPGEQALTVLEQFLRAVMPPNGELFGEIIYLPGNHDHHVWQTARETQYLNYLTKLAPEARLEAPWDTTKVMMNMAGEDRLVNGPATAIAHRIPHLRERGFEVLTAYPNFGVGGGDGRGVVFHHGHFIEAPYRFTSELVTLFYPEQGLPADVYTLERENSAWIDFLWSAMGGCGRVGEGFETLYESTSSRERLERVTDRLAAGLARRYAVPNWMPRGMREWGMKTVFRQVTPHIARGMERQKTEGAAPLSPDASQGLSWYVGELLRRQLEVEEGRAPDPLTFVFGHTHKPTVECRGQNRFLNTGGWVVDSPQPAPLHGGAAVLVGEDLSAVSLRFYSEGPWSASVEEPVPAGASHGVLFEQVRGMLRAEENPWKAFAGTVRAEFELRAANLARRLQAGPATS